MLMFEPLRKYADFTGRARRSEYWLYALFIFLAACVTGVLDMVLFGENRPVLTGILALATFVPTLAVAVRRLHDTNRSGWWYLINLIPLLGGLVFFIFTVLDGTAGPNRFGPDPKGRGGETAGEVFA